MPLWPPMLLNKPVGQALWLMWLCMAIAHLSTQQEAAILVVVACNLNQGFHSSTWEQCMKARHATNMHFSLQAAKSSSIGGVDGQNQNQALTTLAGMMPKITVPNPLYSPRTPSCSTSSRATWAAPCKQAALLLEDE